MKLLLALASLGWAHSFYDCDSASLAMTDQELRTHFATESGLKFSSTCLQVLLERMYLESAEFLLAEYYPETKIDTEVTLRAVIAETTRKQAELAYWAIKPDLVNQKTEVYEA